MVDRQHPPPPLADCSYSQNCICFKSVKLLLLDSCSITIHRIVHKPHQRFSSLTMFTDTKYITGHFCIKPTPYCCHVYILLPISLDEPSHKSCLPIPFCIFFINHYHYSLYETSISLQMCSKVLFSFLMFIHSSASATNTGHLFYKTFKHVHSSYPSLP